MSSVLLYGVLAIVTTWPLVTRLDQTIIMGTEYARTVPLFNAWTLWWNVDRLENGFSGYWDAPIFYPEPNTFALSEPQPFTVLTAPAIWLTGSVFVASNLYALLALFLNGWVTERCLLGVGLRRAVAVGAGVAMSLLPIVHWQIGVAQLVPVWGIIWLLYELYRTSMLPSEAKKKHVLLAALRLALAFTVTMWMCVHHALFIALVLGLSLPFHLHWLLRIRSLATCSLAAVLAVTWNGWIILHLKDMPIEDVARSPDLIRKLVLQWGDYLAIHGRTFWPEATSVVRPWWFASPGWAKLVLAVLALLLVWKCLAIRRWYWIVAVATVLATLLSLGPNVSVFGWEPWWFIARWAPGFEGVRNVFRFVYIAQIGVVLLAAMMIHALLEFASPRCVGTDVQPDAAAAEAVAMHQNRWSPWRILLFGVTVVGGLVAAIEVWPVPLKMVDATNAERHQDWLRTLMDDVGEHPQREVSNAMDGRSQPAVLCLPMAGGDTVKDYEITADWMVLSTFHDVPLVNGYSGFFPPSYYDVKQQVWQREIRPETARQLFDQGVRWLVVDRALYRVNWGETEVRGAVTLKRISNTEQRYQVYRLQSE